jgi:hypothetical protein
MPLGMIVSSGQASEFYHAELGEEFAGFLGEFAEVDAGFAAVAFAEADGYVAMGPAGFFQADGQSDIGEVEI